MFNSGFRGRRENDGQGSINPQAQYVQNKYPQPYISGWSISGTDDTSLNPAGGQTVLVNGSGFAAGVSATVGGVQIGSVTLVKPTQISFTAPANSGGSYTLIVYNSTGGAAILVPGLVYSAVPTWTTAAGSIGSYYETTAINSNVVATSDSALTYALTSGSLPSGATLYANGVITGTAPVDSGSTTYTFDITATDAELQDTTRTFTLTINVDVVTWVTPTNGTTYTVSSNVAISNVSLSATDAAGYGIVYSANSLPTGVSITGNVITGTPTVGANTSTLLTATANTTGRTATNTINWVVTLGDNYWNLTTLALNSLPTTTPFQSDASLNNTSITPVADTRASPYNPYQTGYYSNYFDGTGDYLSTTVTGQAPGTGNFTYECWFYVTSLAATRAIMNTRSGDTTDGFDLSVNTSGAIVATYTATGLFTSTSGVVVPNKWYHIAVVRTLGTTITVYLNGTSLGNFTAGGSTNFTSTTLYVGAGALAGVPMLGYISNFRYTRYAVYNTAFTPGTVPLVPLAGTALLTAQSQRLIDTSPNNFAITKNGDTTAVPANPFATVYDYGTTYYSTYFDGTGDYLAVADNAALQFSTGNFTIECWVYEPDQSGVHNTVIGKWGTGFSTTGDWSLRTRFNSVTQLAFTLKYSGGYYDITTSFSVSNNAWHHIAVVRDSSTTIKLYADGVLKATQAVSSGDIVGSSATLSIGGNSTALGNEGASTGCISNARIVKGQALYTANFTPSTSPLTTTSQDATAGNVSLLTCQSSTAIDNSTNAFAITSNGDARPVPQSPFYSAYYSGYFDGSGDYLSLGSNAAFAFGTGAYTVEFWVNHATLSTVQVYNVNQTTSGLQIWFDTTQGISVGAYGSSPVITSGLGYLTANAWYHVAVSRQSTSANATKIFVNGAVVATGTDANNYSVTGPLYIGSQSGGNGVNGYMSNFRFTKGQALYTAAFTPSTTPLTTTSQGATASNVSVLTCQSLYFIDNSTNVFAITVNGNTAVATVAPFTQPSQYGATTAVATYGSGYFDGTGDYLTIPSSGALTIGTSSATVEFWIYPTSVSGYQRIVTSTIGGFNAGTFCIRFNNGTFAAGAVGGNYINSSTVPTLNSWSHIVWVGASGTTQALYINGVSVGTSTTYNITEAIQYIGGYYNVGPAEYTNGYISNLRIVKGTALYTANFLPSPTPLTAVTNTQLLTLQYDGGSNDSQFRDDSNFQNLITRAGNATQGTFTPFSATGWSAYFDGSGDYLSLTTTTPMVIGTSVFTMEAWVYPTSYGHSFYIIESRVGNSTGAGTYSFYIGTSGQLLFDRIDGSGTIITTANSAIPLNAWTHVAVVRNSSNVWYLYVNGVSSGTTAPTNTYNLSSTNTTYIGYNDDTNLWSSYGYISNLRVVKGTAVYTSNFTPSTTPLVAIANTSLLTLQSPAFIDNSANRFTITRAGDSKTQSFSPFSGVTTTQYYSNYFDGSGDYLSLATNAAFNFSTGDFTVEAWVYPTSLATDWFVISATGSGGLFVGYATGFGFGWGRTAVAWDYRPGTLTANAWQHVAVTRSGTSMYVFVNGTQAGTTQTLATAYNLGATATTVGSQGANYYLNGYISNLRVVKGQALYTANFTPATSPLTTTSQGATAANVSLLTCQSSTFIDNSTNAFAITVNGDSIPTTFAPFAATSTTGISYTTSVNGGSMYFDGSGDYLSLPTGLVNFLSQGISSWTIEFWSYHRSTSAMCVLATASASAQVGIMITLNYSSLSEIDMEIFRGSSGNFYTVKTGSVLTTNAWNHIAITFNGSSTFKMYVNGISRTITTTGTLSFNTAAATAQPTVGTYGAGNYFSGWMSNFRILAGTVAYTSSFSPPTAPPVPTAATTVLLNSTNGSIIDYTGKNDLETVGDARLAPQNPYGGSYYSNYFDGTGDYLNLAANAAFAFGTGDFTVECWVNYTNKTNSGIFQIGATLFPTVNGIGLGLDNGPNWMLYYGNGSQTAAVTGPTNGVWYHVAVVRSSSVTKVYVNGSSTISTADSANYTGSTLGIAGIYSTSYLMNGYISNFRVTKGQALYTTTFTPATSPLTTTSQSATAGNVSLLTLQSPSFIDNSANRFTITTAGDSKTQSFSPFGGVTTTQYYSNYFDGTGDYLSLATNAAFDFSTGSFTVEAWVYPTSLATDWFVISATGSGGLFVGYATGFGFGWGRTAVAWDYRPGTLTANTWQHVAVTRSGTSMYVFVNGTQAGTTQTLSTAYNLGATATTVGSQGANYYLTGYISNLRVIKGQALYTTNFTPATSPLTTTSQSATAANVSLLTCQSSTFIDNSTNAFAITVNGNSIPTIVAPFAATSTTQVSYTTSVNGGSMYFDGTGDYLTIPANSPSTLMGYSDFTVEAWIYPTTYSGTTQLIAAGQNDLATTTGSSWLLYISSTANSDSYSGSTTIAPASPNPVKNQWSHVAYVRSGTSLKTYLNGVQAGSASFASATTAVNNGATTYAPSIGAFANGGSAFAGYMSNFRITKSALYTAAFVPPNTPATNLVTTTLSIAGTNGSIIDYTGKNDLETVADARLAPQNPYGGSYYSNYFDGTGDYLSTPSNAAFTFGTGDFTVEFWIYPLAYGSSVVGAQIFGTTNGSATGYSINLGQDINSFRIISNASGGWADNLTVSAGNGPSLNVWTHMAVVRSGANLTIYKNGVSVATTSSAAAWNFTGTVATIGYFSDGTYSRFLTGYISNLRAVKGQALYTTTFTPATSPLTTTSQSATAANVSLLTCQSSTFKDNSTNAFTVTRNGDTAVNSINPFQNNGTYSMYFDGTGDYNYIPATANFQFGTGDFTIEFWLYLNSVASNQVIYDNRNGANGAYPTIYMNTSSIRYYTNSADQITGATLTTGQWYYIAVCKASGSTKLFVNGTQSGSTFADSMNYLVAPLRIGSDYTPSSYLNGYVTDLRVTKYARYTTTFTPPTSTFQTK